MSHDGSRSTLASAPESIRFCARCATPMETRPVAGRPRRACPSCGHVHFVEPKVGIGVMLVERNEILLVRRAKDPERGKWSVPAGFLDHGDDPIDAAIREAREETHLEVAVTGLVDVFRNPPQAGGASIFILYRAHRIGGGLAAGDDAEDARFFRPDRLPEIAFPSSAAAIRILEAEIRGE